MMPQQPELDLVWSPSAEVTQASSCTLIAAVEAHWEAGAPADAQAILAQRPDLAQRKSVVLDLAYLEYCTRLRRGEQINSAEFCHRFPDHQHSLARLISVHKFVANQDQPLSDDDLILWPLPGDQFANYEVLDVLGRGGLARVYLAHDPIVDRTVVIKCAADDVGEARTMGGLTHPNVIPVFHASQDIETGLSFVTMPYHGSATLLDLLDVLTALARPTSEQPDPATILRVAQTRKLSEEPTVPDLAPSARWLTQGSYAQSVAYLARELASALAYLHARGIYHGDLKPSNILLAPNGKPILIDFNLAQDAALPKRRLGGTLPYMAPEQLAIFTHEQHSHHIDAATEIFAFGVILYQLLTGQHPFGVPLEPTTTGEAVAQLQCQLQAGCLPCRATHPWIPQALADLVHDCLALAPGQRPPDMDVIAQRLTYFLEPAPPSTRPLRYAFYSLSLLAAVGLGNVLVSPPSTNPPADSPKETPVQRVALEEKPQSEAPATPPVIEEEERQLEALDNQTIALHPVVIENKPQPALTLPDLDATTVRPYFEIAQQSYHNSQLSNALVYLDGLLNAPWTAAMQQALDRADVQFLRGKTLTHLGYYAEALKDFSALNTAAIQPDGKLLTWMAFCTSLANDQNSADKAYSLLDQATQAGYRHPAALNNRAFNALWMERPTTDEEHIALLENALADLNLVLEAQPRHFHAQFNRVRTEERLAFRQNFPSTMLKRLQAGCRELIQLRAHPASSSEQTQIQLARDLAKQLMIWERTLKHHRQFHTIRLSEMIAANDLAEVVDQAATHPKLGIELRSSTWLGAHLDADHPAERVELDVRFTRYLGLQLPEE